MNVVEQIKSVLQDLEDACSCMSYGAAFESEQKEAHTLIHDARNKLEDYLKAVTNCNLCGEPVMDDSGNTLSIGNECHNCSMSCPWGM